MRTSFVYKTSRLVRICLLISALNKRVLPFFSGKLFYKSNRKLFTCVFISCYKHSRGWENSPNPSSVYIRLCKQGKRLLLLNCYEPDIYGIQQIDSVDEETLLLFTSKTDKACLRDSHCFMREAEKQVHDFCFT